MRQTSWSGHCGSPLFSVLRCRPQATACIAGGESHPRLSGTVRFYQTGRGVIVCAEISGLPTNGLPCSEGIFGFHIHGGTDCGGSPGNPFSDSLAHYDRDGCPHPFHSGDLPPLFGNNGFAFSLFLTSRFSVEEIIGRTVIIHDHPDDFTSQPSGNSGVKIACGVIRRTACPC